MVAAQSVCSRFSREFHRAIMLMGCGAGLINLAAMTFSFDPSAIVWLIGLHLKSRFCLGSGEIRLGWPQRQVMISWDVPLAPTH